MCIQNVKELNRSRWGTGYKVFSTVDGHIYGDWTLGKRRPLNSWINHENYEAVIVYSTVEGGGMISGRTWPDGFTLFEDLEAAIEWMKVNAWSTRSNRYTATVYKIKYRKARHRGKTKMYHDNRNSYYPTLIAEEIKILGRA